MRCIQYNYRYVGGVKEGRRGNNGGALGFAVLDSRIGNRAKMERITTLRRERREKAFCDKRRLHLWLSLRLCLTTDTGHYYWGLCAWYDGYDFVDVGWCSSLLVGRKGEALERVWLGVCAYSVAD